MSKANPDIEIRRLQKELENKLGWGNAKKWHSSMFTELSEKIFEKIKVSISASTLKRFFGVVKHDSFPSISTLNYLSQFLDYENWRAFKLSKGVSLKPISKVISSKSMYVSFGFVLAVIATMIIANTSREPSLLADHISFESQSITNTFPNTVVFDLDLKGIQSDNIYIQQYWDPTKTISINGKQNQATGIYYHPGYFRAKLVIDGEVVREHDLFLKSNGWSGTIEYAPVPKYFKPKSKSGVHLSYAPQLISEIRESNERLSTTYHFINDLGDVSGDDFNLEASMRTTYNDKWAVCQSVRIYIIGTKGAMVVPFSRLGCSSDNNLKLNDLYLDGKKHDLSAFGVDLSEFTPVRIVNESKAVKIYIRDSVVYSRNYNESMGRIVGLRFKFLGLGEVANFKFFDQDDQKVFFDLPTM